MELKWKTKVQKFGKKGSFAITLPIEWIREMKIEKGDILEITLGNQDSLNVKPIKQE